MDSGFVIELRKLTQILILKTPVDFGKDFLNTMGVFISIVYTLYNCNLLID